MNKIILCKTCEYASGSPEEAEIAIAAELAGKGLEAQFEIVQTECMGGCEEPVSLALQGEGKATYLFTGIRFPEDAVDTVRTCGKYLQSDQGWIEDATGCGRLRHCLRARIPAIG